MFQNLILKKAYTTNQLKVTVIALALLLLLCPLVTFAQYETPQKYSVQSLLKPEVRKGKHFTVAEEVTSDGFFYHYTVLSPYGTFTPSSTSALYQLTQELNVIAAMKKIATDDTAIAALKQSGKNAATGIKNLFTNTEETLQGAAAGVSSLFNRASNTIGSRQVTDAEDTRAQQIIGFSKSKGKIATQYGVNVYSANTVLQEELDRLAWADYLGGLGVGVAMSAVPGVGGLVLTTSGTARLLNEAINNTPASELWLQNKNKLLAMGMNADTVQLFLNNSVFNPALATVTVSALEKMKGVENLELFIKVGLQASDPQMARVITTLAVMSAGYHQQIAPLKRISPLARITKATTTKGETVVVLPTDHIIWSENVAGIARSLTEKSDSKETKKQLWVLGDFSPVASANLQEMGWTLQTNVRDRLIPSKK
ncbi:hypothetical protein [Desulfogranum marinum]|uniref:hypothetical protein n=1 Tax=Desulfogranum marinum TaxID=453220 RepID=UPI001962B7CC|nr:hypothetical protein [Desulfogranum marinum]MBM9515177.1 hypothetical protein [Desulfogranum marinum]